MFKYSKEPGEVPISKAEQRFYAFAAKSWRELACVGVYWRNMAQHGVLAM